jgi:hypothetical protein
MNSSKCNNDANCNHNDGPFAIYRKLNGVSIFTGMVKYARDATEFYKLDDMRGPLDGPVHKMSDAEVLSEFQHYDDSSVIFSSPCDVLSPGCDLLPDSEEGYFDTPSGPGAPVRAGDRVKIAARSTLNGVSGRERFWVDVISVTSFGIATGVPCSKLYGADVGPDVGPIHFEVAAVIGMKKGPNW